MWWGQGAALPSDWMGLTSWLPQFPPRPVVSLPLPISSCGHWVWDPRQDKEPRRGKILLFLQMSVVTQSLPVWNLIHRWTRLVYTCQSPDCATRWNECNLGDWISLPWLMRKEDYFKQNGECIRKSTLKRKTGNLSFWCNSPTPMLIPQFPYLHDGSVSNRHLSSHPAFVHLTSFIESLTSRV